MLLAMDMEAIVEQQAPRPGRGANSKEVEALDGGLNPQRALVDSHLADESSGLDVCGFIRRRWPETLVVSLFAT